MKKVGNFFLNVFAIGVTVCLFAGAVAFVGFIAALCIGGETATTLCVFIHKTYFPWIIRFTSISAFSGLIGMYINQMSSLTISSHKKDSSTEKKNG